MNPRSLFIGIFSVVGLATVTGVVIQKQQLASLRSEQQAVLAQLGTPSDATSEVSAPPPKAELPSPTAPSLELLRLRSEVARLTERRRELSSIRTENEHLRVQVAASRTNVAAANALPPDYMRKSEARFVGYNTPADTIQSLLWAVQNRDLTNMMEAFTPEMSQQLRQEV
jgi:hypothetical protein